MEGNQLFWHPGANLWHFRRILGGVKNDAEIDTKNDAAGTSGMEGSLESR
jgi:hypothetical protein